MNISYRDDLDGIEAIHLQGFFVGWPDPPDPATHLEILRRSSYVCLPIDDSSGQVAGFVNAVSDGVLSAYIPLLEVLPSHQGRGIGRALVTRMVARLSHLYMIDLVCDESLERFYRPLGFGRLRGMGIRNYERQSGSEPTGS